MKTKITFVLFAVLFTFSCQSAISLKDGFTLESKEALLVVDLERDFEVGFVNPSYYISNKRRKSAEALVERINPKNYIIDIFKEQLIKKFDKSLLKIKKAITSDIPYLPKVENVPDVRAPRVNPEIDISKLKEKYPYRYIILLRFKHLRFELDVRPFVKDKIEAEPVLAIYDTKSGKKIYLDFLGTRLGLHEKIIAFTLTNHLNNDENVNLFKKKALELSVIITDKLTQGLKKLF
jgi:hypothetical protein